MMSCDTTQLGQHLNKRTEMANYMFADQMWGMGVVFVGMP